MTTTPTNWDSRDTKLPSTVFLVPAQCVNIQISMPLCENNDRSEYCACACMYVCMYLATSLFHSAGQRWRPQHPQSQGTRLQSTWPTWQLCKKESCSATGPVNLGIEYRGVVNWNLPEIAVWGFTTGQNFNFEPQCSRIYFAHSLKICPLMPHPHSLWHSKHKWTGMGLDWVWSLFGIKVQ